MLRIIPIMEARTGDAGCAAPAAAAPAARFSSCSRTLAVSIGSVASSAVHAPSPAHANVAYHGSAGGGAVAMRRWGIERDVFWPVLQRVLAA